MKKVYIMRHGDYQYREGVAVLSSIGLRQIEDLAIKIGPEINGLSIKIITSSSRRACDSAKVLAEVFQADFEKHDCLRVDDESSGDFTQAINVIKENDKKTDVLIVLTHYEYSLRLTDMLAVGIGINAPFQNCQMGQAYEIDFEKKHCRLIA